MKRFAVFAVLTYPILLAGSANCLAQQQAYSFSDLAIPDFTLTTLSGSAQPTGPVTGMDLLAQNHCSTSLISVLAGRGQ